MGKAVHRLFNINKKKNTGTCSHCGDNAPLRFRKSGNRWSCKHQDKRFSHLDLKRKKWNLDRENQTKKQNGLCAICNNIKPLVLDHDHTTGRPRGALCGPCNSGLGMFADAVERLLAAATYLKAWEVKHGPRTI